MDLNCRSREKKLAFEMRCYPKLFNISYKDHATNKEVCKKIQAAIGEYDKLLILVKKWKLRWFGQITKSSGLAKTILQGTVKGKRRGRHKKRWKTILESGQKWNLSAQLGQLKTGQGGKELLQIHLWCPDGHHL